MKSAIRQATRRSARAYGSGRDPGQGANNGRLYLKVCHVTPIPPEPPMEHRYANNSNLSIDVEHTM